MIAAFLSPIHDGAGHWLRRPPTGGPQNPSESLKTFAAGRIWAGAGHRAGAGQAPAHHLEKEGKGEKELVVLRSFGSNFLGFAFLFRDFTSSKQDPDWVEPINRQDLRPKSGHTGLAESHGQF